jgi:two-component system LytT family response regulator
MKITALIVDDEPDAQDLIELLLNDYFPQVEVLTKLSSVDDAYRFLTLNQVDVVFLDIQLGNQTGFDLLQKLKAKVPPRVIFVTAYDEYAMEAIKASAQDYVLKPIDEVEFKEAVDKVVRNEQGQAKPSKTAARIAIPTFTGLDFVHTKEILFCEADNSYTLLYFEGGDKTLVSMSLSRFEKKLSKSGFVRIHNKYLVNLDKISAYNKGPGGGYIILTNQATLPVSARKKQDLLSAFC